jgi:hypothetical protein
MNTLSTILDEAGGRRGLRTNNDITFAVEWSYRGFCMSAWDIKSLAKGTVLRSLLRHLSFIVFSFFDGTGAWTQGLVFARQVLYHMSHAPNSEVPSFLRPQDIEWICLLAVTICVTQW